MRDEDLPFLCGNCRFHDEWLGTCSEPNSPRLGASTMDCEAACGEWERIEDEETVTIKYERICE